MACARCPYTSKYELLWTDDAAPDVIAVLDEAQFRSSVCPAESIGSVGTLKPIV
mgnify:CR=1 FL=1